MFKLVGLAFLFTAFLAGCTGGIRRDVGTLGGRVAAAEQKNAQQDEAIITFASQQAIAADLLQQATERLAGVETRTEEAHKRVSALEAEHAKTRAALAGVERRVNGVASSLNARVGVVEDAGGFDHKNRVFRIGPFPVGKYETPDGWTPEAIQKAIADGWMVKAVVGFADTRPFKVAEESAEKNKQLAEARAKSVADTLKVDPATVLVEGRGSTDKFGGLKMNRSVLVYLEPA